MTTSDREVGSKVKCQLHWIPQQNIGTFFFLTWRDYPGSPFLSLQKWLIPLYEPRVKKKCPQVCFAGDFRDPVFHFSSLFSPLSWSSIWTSCCDCSPEASSLRGAWISQLTREGWAPRKPWAHHPHGSQQEAIKCSTSEAHAVTWNF